jgi:hypothetical protein
MKTFLANSSMGGGMMVARFAAVIVLMIVLSLAGCGGTSAKVTGKVTCQGKPVVGGILFSPIGDGSANTGPAVNATLNDDGSYSLRLTTIGKHNVVITPRDVKLPAPKGGFDYPCDRSPLERDVKAGDNDITIEMAVRTQ